jgi:hypothetical protein
LCSSEIQNKVGTSERKERKERKEVEIDGIIKILSKIAQTSVFCWDKTQIYIVVKYKMKLAQVKEARIDKRKKRE